MSWLYAVTIYPIELLFRYVYLFCTTVTGSYGIGLMAMTVCIAVIYWPVKKFLNAIQAEENDLQATMQQYLNACDKNCTSSEKHAYTLRVYRRFGYHPLMALRATVPVMMEIPFLMAAFYMISGLTELQGQSFLFLKDLSRPDGLLFGSNLMPWVMTGVNALTIILAPEMRAKDRLQAALLAVLFLWLLYDAPCALLVYWTGNNVLYLAETVLRLAKTGKSTKRSAALHADGSGSGAQQNHGLLSFLRPCLPEAAALLISLALLFVYRFLFDMLAAAPLQSDTFSPENHLFRLRALYTGMGIAALLPLAVSLYRQIARPAAEIAKGRRYFAAVCIFLHAALLPVILFSWLLPMGEDIELNGSLPLSLYTWLCVLAPLSFCVFRSRLQKNGAAPADDAQTGFFPLYMGGIAAAAGGLLIFAPAGFYVSDSSYFSRSLPDVYISYLPCIAGIPLAAWLLWKVFPPVLRRAAACLACFTAVTVLLNLFVFTGNYGVLDWTVFSEDRNLYSSAVWYTDALVFSAAVIAVFAACISSSMRKSAAGFLSVAALSSVLYGAYGLYAASGMQTAQKNRTADRFPAYHSRLWNFSAHGQNVVVFFLDMFTGGHMPALLAESPELGKDLDGFIWYPDTISAAANTFLSSPSLYAGEAYLPHNMNDSDRTPLIDKYHRALAFMPGIFSAKGFDCSVAGSPTLNPERFFSFAPKETLVLDELWGKDYISYWADRNKSDLYSGDLSEQKHLLLLSLFRGVPHSLKASLYRHGSWDTNGDSSNIIAAKLAPMQHLADFVQKDSEKSTFKIVYSMLGHMPWGLKKDSVEITADPYPATDGCMTKENHIIPEHLYSEKHLLRFIADFCNRLKAEGIYDNTRIILVSDHDEADSPALLELFGADPSGQQSDGLKLLHGRPHALLMVKDFNSRGELAENRALMYTADVPALSMMDIAEAEGIPSREELTAKSGQDRIRWHCSGPWMPVHHDRYAYKIDEKTTVKGTIFDRKNWSFESRAASE